MQDSKRLRLGPVTNQLYALLDDPLRLRWFILYLGIALECDSPILELFWVSTNQRLRLLMKPEALVTKFEKCILPHYNITSIQPLRYCYTCKTVPISKAWTCTFRAHNESNSLRGTMRSPEFTFDFGSVLMEPDGRFSNTTTRTASYEIDFYGFHLYSYKATFRKWIKDFESLDEMLKNFAGFNTLILANID
jgi:hypothetical protein